jgi:glutathione S-transferase
MLKVWGRTSSINVQKVLWCCDEIGLAYERIDAGLHFGVNDTPEYAAMNPTGLVPTITDGDVQLWESNVIVRYLSPEHSMGGLCPADIAARFDAERWMDWQTAQFWAVLRPLYIALIRTPAGQPDAGAITRAEALSYAAVRVLDARLADRRFLAGDAFTRGDIPAAATVHRWYSLAIERPELPNLMRWHQRIGPM